MVFVIPFVASAKTFLIQVAPDMPSDYWWVTGGVLFILTLAATIDAFTEIIPEGLIFLGLIAVTATQGLYASWGLAAHHLTEAVVAGAVIWVTNFLWYTYFRYDALGMGDAKWTMLAVACFDVMPVVYAWGIGAVIAVIYIGSMRLIHYHITQITFAPFLLVGLGLGVYWLRFYLT